MVYTIYKATNLQNNKSYIGFDSRWPNRKRQHKYRALTKNYNSKFYNAIRKYGWDNFEWTVVYESSLSEETLKIKEPYYINLYDSIHNGYNLSLGGEGPIGHKQSEEHKLAISKGNKGKQKPPRTDEHNRNHGNSTAKSFIGISPDGIEFRFKNMSKFCHENGLNQGKAIQLARGNINQYRGWSFQYDTI